MATNPMQRKARNSFLLGMLIMLIVLGAVIALLFIQLKNYKDKETQDKAASVRVWVLSQNVISGQIITPNMLSQQIINKNLVPSNAIGDMSILNNYSLTDKEGNAVETDYTNGNTTLYIVRNNSRYELKQEVGTDSYYIERNGNKEYIELVESPLIAKVNMYKNTVITVDMISKSDEKTTDNLRVQEYNMIELPTQIESGEYVDVRLALASGQDYIVVSKKQIEIPEIDGVPSDDTILLNLREEEIITMNNAIVDAYRMSGARIYINRYKEAGVQDAATPTYVPSLEVMRLISDNPNIISEARNALVARYNESYSRVRDEVVNPSINSNPQASDNLNAKIQESQTNAKQERQEYLESLGGSY